MSKYQTIAGFFEKKSPADVEKFVEKNLDISQQVYAFLKKKNWTQKEFAKKLGKTDAEVSKWLSGSHNLTLRSIAKMEAVLGEDIIMTSYRAKKKFHKVRYVPLRVEATVNKLVTDNYAYSFTTARVRITNPEIRSIS